jgi:hypothetical protein
MKKLLFLLLPLFYFGQDFARDTMAVGGTQPATILRMGNHKIYMIQNINLQTPYIKQKNGNFISNGVPYVDIDLDKKKFVGNMYDFMDELLYKSEANDQFSKFIIEVKGTQVFFKIIYDNKNKAIGMSVNYPLKDRFINIFLAINYTDQNDKEEKETALIRYDQGWIYYF